MTSRLHNPSGSANVGIATYPYSHWMRTSLNHPPKNIQYVAGLHPIVGGLPDLLGRNSVLKSLVKGGLYEI